MENHAAAALMILTAAQPVYLPWLGLFDKIAQADTFVSFDQVQYMPKEWQNRNRIKTPQGPIWLTVPVHRKGHREKPLSEIRINYQEPWQKRHLRAIEMSYGKAPYFERYIGHLREFYSWNWDTLCRLNEHMLQWLLDELGLRPRFLRASDYDFHGAKSELVLDMCRRLGADTYVFGGEGRNYADVEAFEAAGVVPLFQDYEHPVYPQLYGEFVEKLSVLDLLMNCGPDSLEVIRGLERVDATGYARLGE